MKIVKKSVFILLLIGILSLASQICCDVYSKQKGMINNSDRNKSFAGIASEKKNTIDVLVLGDSESYTSVSPMKLWQDTGISAYICGQSGQKIQETYYMLKTALRTQSPKLVILETNTLFRQQEIIKEIQTSAIEMVSYYFPVFRYHDSWKLSLKEKADSKEDYKGFSIREAVDSYDGGEYMKETDAKEEISSFVQMYMEKIRKLCKKKGINLLLVSVPSPVNYNYQKHNAIADYAGEKGIPYLDLNLKKELGIDWKVDSMDKGDHLNLSGAHKVTEYLGNYLKESYKLADHRTEQAYQEWNIVATFYKEKAEEKVKIIRKENT